ncbi:hypothetical protein NQ176_g5324 [Zarea fungicola]|uniref:Uncharacterized protein n=1 Tax=Zarea fungicola TaxID=93591 RepID=A0ACC1NAI0_9HYPO|nr:hypothetical protein NQ176_g5324 [Lecanicillium fungicola]
MPVPGHDIEEREPLLTPNGQSRYTEATKATTAANASESAYLRVLMVGYAIFTLSQFHANIFNTAMKQLVEGNLCRSFNDNVTDPTKDPRCKGEQTQAELSLIFSMESTFELIPGLLLSIPYGMIADAYGRRFVAFLSILGCVFYSAAEAFVGWRSDILSPRWIWAVPITTLVGGGSAVFPTMVYTMISDVAPKSKR